MAKLSFKHSLAAFLIKVQKMISNNSWVQMKVLLILKCPATKTRIGAEDMHILNLTMRKTIKMHCLKMEVI